MTNGMNVVKVILFSDFFNCSEHYYFYFVVNDFDSCAIVYDSFFNPKMYASMDMYLTI